MVQKCPCARYHFATAQPYSLARFAAYRETVLSKYAFVKSEVLTRTVQGRDLHLLTITHPKNLGAAVVGGGSSEGDDDSVPKGELVHSTSEIIENSRLSVEVFEVQTGFQNPKP